MRSYKQNDKKDEDYEKNVIRSRGEIQKFLYPSMADTCTLTDLILISNFLLLCRLLLQKRGSEIPESPVTLKATYKKNGYVTQLGQ